MELKPGMRFVGNMNGRKIEIIKAAEKDVTYREIKTGAKFTIGRAIFEHLELRRIENEGGKAHE